METLDSEKIKVLVFARSIGKKTLTFIYNELDSLSKREDITLRILTHSYENQDKFPMEEVYLVPQRKVGNIEVKLRFKLRQWGVELGEWDASFRKEINKQIDEFQPDIIHCHFGDVGIRFYNNLSAVHKQIPLILHFHGYDASQKLRESKSYRIQLKKLLKRENVQPIFVSKYMVNNVLNSGIVLNNHNLLYYGTNNAVFTREKKQSTKCVFLQVSSLVEKKGHFFTLKAFKQFLTTLNNPQEYKLVITGGGDSLDNFKKLAKVLGIESFVKFTDWVNVDEAKVLMNEADFFVHHSVTATNGDKEGIPNAIMEAMSMELPVISTYHSGIPELVEDGVNGYLVEERDVDAYAQRMLDILDWEYKKINREKILNSFDKEKHADRLISLYQKTIRKST